MKKNRFIKLISTVISAAIVFGCLSVSAFAFSVEEEEASYELYQIFTGTFGSNGVLSNVMWGKNGKNTSGSASEGTPVSTEVLQELVAISGVSDTERLAVITKYANLEGDPYRGSDQGPDKDESGLGYTYTGIVPGYYLIKELDGSKVGEAGAYTLYVVKATGTTLTFEPKESVPTVSKQVNDQRLTGANSASIGEEVNYVITGSVPNRIADYATYYYKFTDTLSKGLTYKADSLQVQLKNGSASENVTSYFYVNATPYSEDSGTTITVAIGDLKALTKVAGAGYTVDGSTQVVITYTATLNEKALIKEPNNNSVKLIYSNDPNNSGTPAQDPPTPPGGNVPTTDLPVGETVTSTTGTYTTFLKLTKINQEQTPLQGAVFTLTGSGVKNVFVTEQVFTEDPSGTYYKLANGTYTTEAPGAENTGSYASTETKYRKETVMTLKGEGKTEVNVQGTVDDQGVLVFAGLGEGEYILTETTAPDGYNKIEPITFTITFNPESKTFACSNEAFAYSGEDGGIHSKIINYPGSVLPHTGGIGTTLFYVSGSILALGAFVLFVVKRRMKNENE